MQWRDIGLIVEALEENYFDTDIEELSLADLNDLVLGLPDFSDDPDEVNDRILSKILENWRDLRESEM